MAEYQMFGPLAPLLLDDVVVEIMVNGLEGVFVERRGELEELPPLFHTAEELDAVVDAFRTIAEAQGRRLDNRTPIVDIGLGDARHPANTVVARVNVVLPPIAPFGPAITIRKFRRYQLTAEQLVEFGSWDDTILHFLRACVAGRLNIVVAGGTGAGKTTVLNILTGMIPTAERIITVENAMEIQPPPNLKHVVRLESRPADHEGHGEVTMRELVVNAARMRPDRIILGEARAGEVLDIVQAINNGHEGSMFSVHASGPRDVLMRLETMATMHDIALPLLTVRQMLVEAIDVITYQERLGDGTRKVVKIAEVTGMQGDTIMLQDLFEFRETGVGADGRIQGHFSATGHVPTFMDRFRKAYIKVLLDSAGVDMPLSLFTPRD